MEDDNAPTESRHCLDVAARALAVFPAVCLFRLKLMASRTWGIAAVPGLAVHGGGAVIAVVMPDAPSGPWAAWAARGGDWRRRTTARYCRRDARRPRRSDRRSGGPARALGGRFTQRLALNRP